MGMGMSKDLGAAHKDYEDRSDVEKIHTQWHKITGLHSREEWSAAGVRAATAAEIAANLAIRAEYAKFSTFSAEYVDKLLRFANGLDGKVKRLLLPIFGGVELAKYAGIQVLAESINTRRNKVVHQGEFMDEDESAELIELARKFIEKLVVIYQPAFLLKDSAGYMPPRPAKKMVK
jgi:hypothetical protein